MFNYKSINKQLNKITNEYDLNVSEFKKAKVAGGENNSIAGGEKDRVDFNVRKTMILNKDNIWELAEPEDELEIDSSKEGKKILNFNIDNYTNPDGIIGFIGYKKNSKNYIFKTKDVFSSRDTGATCIEAGKSKTLATLNKIVNAELYTKENTRII